MLMTAKTTLIVLISQYEEDVHASFCGFPLRETKSTNQGGAKFKPKEARKPTYTKHP